MATEDCIPFYEPGKRITAKASAALTSKRLVAISATRTSGPALNTSSEGGTLIVGVCAASAWAFGVAGYDCPSGGDLVILRGSGFVVPITANGAIASGAAVECGASGMVRTHTTGVIVGYAVADAADATDAQIALI